jgi:hypothetical protein
MDFEKNTFKKRLKSMLGVDFRRMFTSPLFYIMVGVIFTFTNADMFYLFIFKNMYLFTNPN